MNNQVLIVDADPMWRQCLGWLIPGSFSIKEARSGEEAVNLLTEDVVLIIAASELGGRMHGLEFISRAASHCTEARIIFVPHFTTSAYELDSPEGTVIVAKQAREAEFRRAIDNLFTQNYAVAV